MTVLLTVGLFWLVSAVMLGLVLGPALRRAADRQSTWSWTQIPDHIPFADPGADSLPEQLTDDVVLRLRTA